MEKDLSAFTKEQIDEAISKGSIKAHEILVALADSDIALERFEKTYEALERNGIEISVENNTVIFDISEEELETEEFDYDKYEQKEVLKTLYAQAIELNCKKGYGLIMPMDMCIAWVEQGAINDYDGIGKLLNKDGEVMSNMRCSVSFLEKAKEKGACFVAWYNK